MTSPFTTSRASRPADRAGRRVRGLLLALIGLTLALGPATAARAQTPPPGTRTMRLNLIDGRTWPTVTLNFNLRSLDNTALGTLAPPQFAVTENGTTQQITRVALGKEIGTPLAVVLVLDTSGSMRGEKLTAAEAAAAGFLNALGPNDEAALVPFSTEVGKPTPFTADRSVLDQALQAQVAQGNTALYDALFEAAQVASQAAAGRRRAIVLLTDGQDTSSLKAPLNSVQAAKDAGALVYTIGVGGDTDSEVLGALSTPTGGRYIPAAGPADLQAIYVQLAQELAGQYLLIYRSTTQVHKAYELIRVEMHYTTPTGETLTQVGYYRPPASAIVPEAAPALPTALPVAQVPIPAGLPADPAAAPPVVAAPPTVDNASLQTARVVGMIAGLLAAAAVLLAFGGLLLVRAPTLVGERLNRYVATPELGAPEVPANFSARVLYPMFDSLGRRLQRLTPAGYLEQLGRLISQAGPSYRMRRAGFLGMQLGLGIVGLVLVGGWALLAAPHDGLRIALAAGLGVFAGIYLPYFQLTRRVTQRKRALVRALPAALDFMAIMVEAGTGFDGALAELVRRWRNTLTDEFALLLIDFQIGKPRRDAWRDLSTRTQVPDLNAFVIAMMQSEQTGSSIAHILRTQADQLRIRRRQRAEEEARTAPVKMLIPLALFIFPCLLIVILGPAIPQILQSLVHLGG